MKPPACNVALRDANERGRAPVMEASELATSRRPRAALNPRSHMSQRTSRRCAPWVLLCLAALASSAHALHGKVVASGFAAPLYVTAPAGDKRIFIVEQGGAIKAWQKG